MIIKNPLEAIKINNDARKAIKILSASSQAKYLFNLSLARPEARHYVARLYQSAAQSAQTALNGGQPTDYQAIIDESKNTMKNTGSMYIAGNAADCKNEAEIEQVIFNALVTKHNPQCTAHALN